jgi:hypothetical protein
MTNLIFDGINFVIIFYVGRYVYLRWFKSQIIGAIASKNQYRQDLNSELSGIENKIKEIALDLVLQQELADDLLQKVQNWQLAHLAYLQSQEAQVKRSQVLIDIKKQLKLQNLAVSLAQKKLLIVVLPKVQQTLVDYFDNRSVATEFLNQACDKLGQN